MDIYCSYLADKVIYQIESAIELGNSEKLAKISFCLQKGDDLFKSWAMSSGGKVIFYNSGYGCVCIPAEKITELPNIKQEYEDLTNGEASIGLGTSIEESYIACQVSSKRNHNTITLFQPEMKLAQEDDMSKAESNPLKPDPSDPPKNEVKPPPEKEEAPIEGEQPPEAGVEQAPPGQEDEAQKTKAMVVQALQQIKENAQVIEKIRAINPRAYEAIKSIVSAMILMAQGMMGDNVGPEEAPQGQEAGQPPPPEQPPVQKSEPLERAVKPENRAAKDKVHGPRSLSREQNRFSREYVHDPDPLKQKAKQGIGAGHQTDSGTEKETLADLKTSSGRTGSSRLPPRRTNKSEDLDKAKTVLPSTSLKEKARHADIKPGLGERTQKWLDTNPPLLPSGADYGVDKGTKRLLSQKKSEEDLDKAVVSVRPPGSVARKIRKPPSRRKGKGPRRKLPPGITRGNKKKIIDPATGKAKWVSIKGGH